MIEVLFGESEAGSMKAAKSIIIAGKADGPTAVWFAGKKRPPKKKSSGWVPGTAAEVVCLGFHLDIGDIIEQVDGEYRGELIRSLYMQQWGTMPDMTDGLKEMADVYAAELARLKEYLKEGEAIRIWHSNAPYSICGFYSLCELLMEYGNDVFSVELPEYHVRKDAVVSYQSWGEITAEEFAGFLPGARKLSKKEIRHYAFLWEERKTENSPLRAVINGRLVSVQEDFYDFMIRSKLGRVPVMEGRLIGDIMLSYSVGVSDVWYARRIDEMIEKGKIKVTQDSDNKYARTICRL